MIDQILEECEMNEKIGDTVGIFVGLESASYEYIGNVILPFSEDFSPKVGDFLLIKSSRNEYNIARVMDYVPKGELTTFMGEKWLADVALYPSEIGLDIKTRKISYRVKVKLLGRLKGDSLKYYPGVETIPHITSEVIHPNEKIVEEICHRALEKQEHGITIGKFWHNQKIDIRFDVKQLVGKRSFIFARAGYGKSNLMKILASNWKSDYGALFIFDPEGEYSVTDSKGKPGILDNIPAILITSRLKIREKVDNNVYYKMKFNLKKFSPNFIIPILVVEEKHEMIFFQKLMSLSFSQWGELVDVISADGWKTSPDKITAILKGEPQDKLDESVGPILNNLVNPIQNLHDPESKLIDILELGAKKNCPVILDISLLNAQTALQLCSIIIGHFFGKNQEKFIGGNSEEDLYRIVFVVEEAQSVIGAKKSISKFIELAKEGRKYQLGGIFITQQPSSIAPEILSQGDNFFIFHMVSKKDLSALQIANAHYSNDILTQILNEPTPGKTYMWSSPQPFVLPIKINSFEQEVKPNNARFVQSKNNLLADVEKQVQEFENLEDQIIEKTKKACQDNYLILSQKNLDEDKRNSVTRAVFKSLTAQERQFLENKGYIQKNRDGEPFAIKMSYFFDLVSKIRKKHNIPEV